MYSGGGENKQFFLVENMKRKSSSRPFLAHSGSGQETTFYVWPYLHQMYDWMFNLHRACAHLRVGLVGCVVVQSLA